MTKPTKLLIPLFIASVLLSACGGDGDSNSDSATITGTGTSTTGTGTTGIGTTGTGTTGTGTTGTGTTGTGTTGTGTTGTGTTGTGTTGTGTTGTGTTGTGTTGTGTITVTPGEFILPFDKEKTWTVCQGYNTTGMTHTGDLVYSLDLSLDANSTAVGTGCSLVTANTSTGQNVYAPADAKLAWYGLDPVPGIGTDVACFTLDKTASNGANSIMVGHLDTRRFVSSGASVKQGTLIGTTNSPSTKNGMYSHIHISTYTSKQCSGGNIPLNTVFGSAYNFTANGSAQQWRGTKVTRR